MSDQSVKITSTDALGFQEDRVGWQKDRVRTVENYLNGFTTRTTLSEDGGAGRFTITLSVGITPAVDGAIGYELRISRREPEVIVERYSLSGLSGSLLDGEVFNRQGQVKISAASLQKIDERTVQQYLAKISAEADF